MFENNEKICLWRKKNYKMVINKMTKNQHDMQKLNNSLSDNILVSMEELVFIYHFIGVNRYDYLNTMETVQ